MSQFHPNRRIHQAGAVLATAAAILVGAGLAGAAERVVLGEYFTSVF
jgi:hypothetical protein